MVHGSFVFEAGIIIMIYLNISCEFTYLALTEYFEICLVQSFLYDFNELKLNLYRNMQNRCM